MPLNSVADIIDDIRQGKMVILMDDEDRENEGDLIIAAEAVTPEIINFFSSEACGLICMPISEAQAQQLQLPLMVRNNRSQHETNFTVSIDAANRIGPGISAAQRAQTVLAAVAADAKPEDIIQPGHIFPLVAKAGGVLRRAGHTEAGVDLARMAGFAPAALIVEIMNEDGTMARRPELEIFGEKHGIKIGTIADMIAYRAMHEQSVDLKDRRQIDTEFGEFTLFTFMDALDDILHYALVKGEFSDADPTLVRVQHINTLRDIFSTRLTDEQPGWSFRRAMQRIADEGTGVMVLIGQQESAGQQLEQVLQFPEVPTPVNSTAEDGTYIYRLIGTGAQILKQVGIGKMRALSAPTRYNALSGFNLEVTEFIES
ncbi:3,4-dihydroxy-2-butanone-4-phosphate synthase [Halieaceae bacterium IMCC14734]|uniref:3,4-dihydroxy-2-butanone 4-phosphate synthase n=1 Tax=Candidatus Litorirhabdus singularis TaxID=2518993 RepID=A0ABT3TI93_9GAMM|nr:3,4-dihydroxy-2-butanone-4-phosphate synthase [Candidatus Litorirhabdus singularis]MCX2981724.1 3,4-dihydroxy-2-butanone-4-phosphate synthase [Candidatus Litorirhabdus singularis]